MGNKRDGNKRVGYKRVGKGWVGLGGGVGGEPFGSVVSERQRLHSTISS